MWVSNTAGLWNHNQTQKHNYLQKEGGWGGRTRKARTFFRIYILEPHHNLKDLKDSKTSHSHSGLNCDLFLFTED
jgi:hypothetical protein